MSPFPPETRGTDFRESGPIETPLTRPTRDSGGATKDPIEVGVRLVYTGRVIPNSMDEGEVLKLIEDTTMYLAEAVAGDQDYMPIVPVSGDLLDKIPLSECVRAAMQAFDLRGEFQVDHVDPHQGIRLGLLEAVLAEHPDVLQHYDGKPYVYSQGGPPRYAGEVVNSTRNSREAIKRAIRKVPGMERRGATRGSFYVYDSTKVENPVPHLVSLLMRTKGDANFIELLANEDSKQWQKIGGSDALLEALWYNDGTFYTVPLVNDRHRMDGEKPIINPSIWSAADSYKKSYNLTLSKPTVDLFEDLTINMVALMEEGKGEAPLGPRDKKSKHTSWWWAAFDQIPIPDTRLSKSLITEIALWNLYHTMHMSSGGDEEYSSKERSERKELIADLVNDERFIAILADLAGSKKG